MGRHPTTVGKRTIVLVLFRRPVRSWFSYRRFSNSSRRKEPCSRFLKTGGVDGCCLNRYRTICWKYWRAMFGNTAHFQMTSRLVCANACKSCLKRKAGRASTDSRSTMKSKLPSLEQPAFSLWGFQSHFILIASCRFLSIPPRSRTVPCVTVTSWTNPTHIFRVWRRRTVHWFSRGPMQSGEPEIQETGRTL